MNIEALEHGYQQLFNAYQANQVDEATFISEVDKLQFQDEWGRYWMIGAQTGAWHYYDGQAWHQADPREADKLPVTDENGVYWQRGLKTGEWYYYQPETGDWVKPSNNQAPVIPPVGMVAPYSEPALPYNPVPQYNNEPQAAMAAPAYDEEMPTGFEGELFQDDEGRYWAVGAKTGQWYFYDRNGWHPAQDLAGSSPMPSNHGQTGMSDRPTYQTQPQSQPIYPSQPTYQSQSQPVYNPPPPPPVYQPAPMPVASQESYLPREENILPRQPITTHDDNKPQPSLERAEPIAPPPAPPPAGSWSYFDGQSWVLTTPPPVNVPSQSVIITQAEPEPEVVEVEVIAFIEPEPDEPEPSVYGAKSARPASRPMKLPADSADWASAYGGSSGVPEEEDVIPRRTAQPHHPEMEEAAVKPRSPLTTTKSNQPTPRPNESAVVIPTGASPSAIPVRPNRPVSQPMRPTGPRPNDQRRARENTMPMSAQATPQREVTQPMPTVAATRSNTDQLKVAATQAPAPTPIPAPPSPNQGGQTEPENLTMGEFLRAIPMTMWAVFGGGLLLVLAFVLIVFGGGLLKSSGVTTTIAGVETVATPTLEIESVPNQTPTSNPTATPTKVAVKSTPSTLSKVCSEELTICLQAPDGWETTQDKSKMAFSTSKAGLDDKNITEAAVRIGRSAKVTTESDLLASLLANFPTDAKSLNAAPLGIAGQKWTSTQIQYSDSKTNQEGIATLAVTIKDDQAYYLVAVAPAEEWNVLRDTYQAMISGLRFVTPEQATEGNLTPTVSKVTSEPESEATTVTTTVEATKTVSSKATEEEPTVVKATAKSTATPKSTPTDAATATPTNSPTPKSTPTPTPTPAPLTYIVVTGDSLGRIAGKFGVDVDLLASENGLDKEKSTLQVGDELIIPFTQEELDAYNKSNGTPVASKATDEATPKATKTTAEGTATVTDTVKATPEATATTVTTATISGRIAYPVFNSGPGSYDIWLADLATNEQVIIANQASQPAFSRNGSLLAYRSWDIRSRGIIYRDFVGGAGGQVTTFVEDALPAWSPDGFTFIFSSRREGDKIPRLFKGDYTRKGSEMGIPFEGYHVDVLPDGQIVSRGCLPGGRDCGLYLLSAVGSNPIKIGTTDDADTAPAASPDGQHMAVMSSGRGGNNWEVWTMNIDGSNPKRLTENSSNDGIPTWSPDGKSIAFASDRGGSWAIWVMNADGTNQTKLFDMKGSPNGKVLADQNNSFGWWEERISWAP